MLNHLSRMSKFNYVFVSVKNFKTAPSLEWESQDLEKWTTCIFNCSCKFAAVHFHHMCTAENAVSRDTKCTWSHSRQHFFKVKRSREKCSFLVVVLYFITWNVFKNNTILVDKLDKCVLLGKYTRQSRTPQRWRKVPVLDWKCFQHKRVIFTINSV